MFCPMCGAPNEEDADFCGNCGAALNPDEAPQVAAEEIPGEDVVEEMIVEAEAFDDAAAAEPEAEVVEIDATPEVAKPPAPPPAPKPAYVPPLPAPGAGLPTSGMAIAALVAGVVGLTLLPLVGSILAVIFGYMARNDIRQRPDEVSGDGLALAGIVMGWIAIGLAVLGLLVGGGIMLCGICGAFGAAGSY